MSSSLLSAAGSSSKGLPWRVSQVFVRYARKESAADPKQELLRRVLYPNNIKNKASPTGTWRPDVARAIQIAIPSVQAHETIERAWNLHQRRQREKREVELERKFECMRRAMDELEKVDMFLFLGANKQEDPRDRSEAEAELLKNMKGTERKALEARIRGLFPRELRIPTDTPPRDGWNYDWKPFPRPL
jgi:large subunit ribosomal protein L40